jgi:hypothetical protein
MIIKKFGMPFATSLFSTAKENRAQKNKTEGPKCIPKFILGLAKFIQDAPAINAYVVLAQFVSYKLVTSAWILPENSLGLP